MAELRGGGVPAGGRRSRLLAAEPRAHPAQAAHLALPGRDPVPRAAREAPAAASSP